MENKQNVTELTTYQHKFLDAVDRIKHKSAKEDRAIACYSIELIHTPLPYSDPGDIMSYRLKNRDKKIYIQGSAHHGYPYGTYPRLILIWIIGEVFKNRYRAKQAGMHPDKVTKEARYIKHGHITQFVRQLGVEPTGSAQSSTGNGTIQEIKDQMLRLLGSKISFIDSRGTNKDVDKEQGIFINVSDFYDLTWHKGKIKENKEAGYFWISEQFYTKLVSSVFPIDLRAVHALRKSPLAIDLYCWATHKAYSLNKPLEIGWEKFAEQFGYGYSEPRYLGKEVRKAFDKICQLYPDLKVEFPRGRIKIYPSSTHIPKNHVPQWINR